MNRAAVVDIAMRAYWDEGPTEVSLNAVCERAGVSKPSVYREFGNDDGLAQAALAHYADIVMQRILEIVSGDGAFSQKLADLTSLVAVDALHDSGCLFVKMRAVKPKLGPKTQEALDHLDSLALGAFTRLMTDSRASGDWTGDVPIDLAARYLHAQIGLALDQRARGEDARETLALAMSVFGAEAA